MTEINVPNKKLKKSITATPLTTTADLLSYGVKGVAI